MTKKLLWLSDFSASERVNGWLILNVLGTRRRWMVRYALRPHYP